MIKFKCPECGEFAEFTAMGPYRVQCHYCDSVIKNEELNIKREVKEK